MKVVDTMKKMISRNTTSTIGVRSIPGALGTR
jgi:hypothetical protein